MSLKPLRRSLGALMFLFCLVGGLAEPAAAQTYRITGTVTDGASQRPLSNVQVLLDGTQQGTLTDDAGRYLLRASVTPGTYTLRFVLIGRGDATREIVLAAGDTLVQVPNVQLRESAVQLDEIVVTGTGVVAERRALGNTVSTVRGDEINNAPAATSIDRALQGKISGAVITQNNGQPGGGVSVRLRGTNSILGGAEPLIVLDG